MGFKIPTNNYWSSILNPIQWWRVKLQRYLPTSNPDKFRDRGGWRTCHLHSFWFPIYFQELFFLLLKRFNDSRLGGNFYCSFCLIVQPGGIWGPKKWLKSTRNPGEKRHTQFLIVFFFSVPWFKSMNLLIFYRCLFISMNPPQIHSAIRSSGWTLFIYPCWRSGNQERTEQIPTYVS